MKRPILLNTVYWGLILLFLTVFFGSKWDSIQLAFYFSCLLLPVVIGTTYIFNSYLVPKFLIPGNYAKFGLYFLYLLIVSLYLEMLVALLSFVILANTNLQLVDLEGISVLNLGVALYLVVFGTSFIRLLIEFRSKEAQIEKLQLETLKNKKETITIRANRKNQVIPLENLLFLESLDDHVKVVTTDGELLTRAKISKLNEELPKYFVRIHRSFVINLNHAQYYTSANVQLSNITLPISRTYKKASQEAFIEFGLTKS